MVFTEKQYTTVVNGKEQTYTTQNAYHSEGSAVARATSLRDRGYDAFVEVEDGVFHVMVGELSLNELYGG